MSAPATQRRHRRLSLIPAAIASFAVAANSFSVSNYLPPSIHVNRHVSCYANPQQKFNIGHRRRRQCCYPSSRSLAEQHLTALRASNSLDGDNHSITPPNNATLSKIFKYDLSVPAVLLASFLNLLGFTMASPIQPALGKHFSLPIGASFGSLSSAYPLGMLLGVFVWPTLSDVLGRKFVMSLTLFGSGMGLLLQSYGIRKCWTLEQFLAARVLTGCFAGNSPISKAYLADRGSSSSSGGGRRGDLSKYLAWKDAASTLAFILGPVFGGLVHQLCGRSALGVTGESNRISFVILCSAVASLLASMAIMLFVKNTASSGEQIPRAPAAVHDNNKDDDKGTIVDATKDGQCDTSTAELISCPLGSTLWAGVTSVAVVSSLYHAADSTFFAFFPTLLQNRLHVGTQAVGMALTSFAIVSFAMSAFVSSRFLKAFGPVTACTAGLGAVGTGLWTLGYAASLPAGINVGVTAAFILGASALYYIGVPLFGPSVPTMLLLCVPAHKRGAVMGFDGAVNTLARVISPLVIGEIHRLKGAGACFRVAGSCAYAAVGVALFRRHLVLGKMFGKSSSAAPADAK
ncbi:hypothetical protein ACHAXH_004025 [Discostella pseudostelligera]